VLTRSAASKYFGQEDPIGKTLELTNESPSGSYTVTGVLEDVPRNSHLQFDFLLSYASLGEGSVQKSWVWSQFYTYIRLRPGSNAKALEARLPAFLKKHNGETCKYEAFLQPLAAIHLTSHYRYEASVNGSERTVNFLLIMAGLILLIAWSNYLNLTSAKAMEKAREIGVRKAVGATRLSLLGQFLVQAFLANGVALLIALVLIGLSLPLFITKITEGTIAFSLFGKGSFWGLSALVFTVVSLVSGAYPALLLSSFGPVEALKGKVKVGTTGLLLRKGLIVGQFAVSITLAIFTLVVVAQYRFMQQQDLGA
jgi:putative ABC transport system permease protein